MGSPPPDDAPLDETLPLESPTIPEEPVPSQGPQPPNDSCSNLVQEACTRTAGCVWSLTTNFMGEMVPSNWCMLDPTAQPALDPEIIPASPQAPPLDPVSDPIPAPAKHFQFRDGATVFCCADNPFPCLPDAMIALDDPDRFNVLYQQCLNSHSCALGGCP